MHIHDVYKYIHHTVYYTPANIHILPMSMASHADGRLILVRARYALLLLASFAGVNATITPPL